MYRRSFLEKKGLTKEEIDEAFQRVPVSQVFLLIIFNHNFLDCSFTGQLIISLATYCMFVCFKLNPPYLWFKSQDAAPTVQTAGVNQGKVSNIEVFLYTIGLS